MLPTTGVENMSKRKEKHIEKKSCQRGAGGKDVCLTLLSILLIAYISSERMPNQERTDARTFHKANSKLHELPLSLTSSPTNF
jgi:hypothetical protein